MTKREFVSRVLALLNEAGLSEKEGFQLTGADNSGVVATVTAVYVAAWRKCVEITPNMWLNVADFVARPTDKGDGSGYVPVPEDWYRLCAFRMEGWNQSVYQCAEEGGGVARMQGNVYARGTMLRPVCVLEKGETGKRLCYYSLPYGKQHEVGIALYVPVCRGIDKLKDEEDLGEGEPFAGVLCYVAAVCVCRVFEKWDAAKSMEQEAVELVKGLMTEERGTV